MKKKAKELKQGDSIEMAGETLVIKEIEISDIGKQGTQKVRIVAEKSSGEKVTIIRPSEYPFNVKNLQGDSLK